MERWADQRPVRKIYFEQSVLQQEVLEYATKYDEQPVERRRGYSTAR